MSVHHRDERRGRDECQVLLVAGWAQPELALVPLQQQLAVFGPVRTLILDQPEALLLAQISSMIAEYQGKTLAVGWSLGGHLLMRALARHGAVANSPVLRDKLAGMACIACNPCFVGDREWPGVGEALFARFEQQLQQDTFSLLNRFCKLQLLGDPQCRVLLRALQPAIAQVICWPPEQLSLSLGWLRLWDCRRFLRDNAGIRFFLGRHDRLVPCQLEAALRSSNSQHQVVWLDNMAHYPHAAAATIIVQQMWEQNISQWEPNYS